MPCCPNKNCQSSHSVTVHGWRDNHFGRRVVGLTTHYFVISRRYRCERCRDSNRTIEVDVDENNCEIKNNTNQQTFMGYNRASNLLLPNGYGLKFPAYLMHKTAIDNDVLDILRPLVSRDVQGDHIDLCTMCWYITVRPRTFGYSCSMKAVMIAFWCNLLLSLLRQEQILPLRRQNPNGR